MGTLSADHTAFRDAVADLHDAAAHLTACRDRATHSVDALLGTWRGAAATSYAEGWTEWRAGADRVLAGLSAMASVLDAVDRDLTSVDASSGDSLDRLTARLG